MLEKLEIHGFKSFGDKVKIVFNPGLTVIVGPNGSGKSNIADAINWALGEQKASALRGARMDEIIFAGSDKRRSVSLCEVSMTLDNKNHRFPIEYSEVTITRRIFRSGESQFFINKVPCRLKDIHTLLMDTGVGRGAYAIIGQGKVEEILQSRAEDRRSIIEEAAGIVKYRYRKEETLRKMAMTEQDMLRLGDILKELGDRLQPLQDEAQKAELYHQYNNERLACELGLLVRALTENEKKLHQIESQLAEIGQEKLGDPETDLQDLVQMESQLQQKEELCQNKQKEMEALSVTWQEKKNYLVLAAERENHLQQSAMGLKEKIAQLTEQISALEKQVEEEKLNLEKSRQLLPQTHLKLTHLHKNMRSTIEELEAKEEELDTGKGQMIELLNQVAQGKVSRQRSEERKQWIQSRLDKLHQQLQQSKVEKEKLNKLLQQLQQEKEAYDQKVSDLQNHLQEKETHKKDLNLKHHAHREKMQQINEKLNNAKSHYRVLVESQENYSGYQRGVREVLVALKKGKVNLKGISGTVAELLHVPSDLEVALETALGGALQNLVTQTDVDARQVIEYLKKNQLGRVTFLPLNTLRPSKRSSLDQEILQMPGILGVAADLITIDPQYQVVAEFLLGRVLIAETIDFALSSARASGQRIRLVTLEGESIYPGGSLSGGSPSGPARGLLKIRRQKEEYGVQVQQLEKEISVAIKQEKQYINEIQQVEEEINQLRDELVKNRINLATKEQELLQMKENIARYSNHTEESCYEINNLGKELQEQDLLSNKATEQIEASNQQLVQVEANIKERQQQLETLRDRREAWEESVTATRINLATLQQQEDGIKKMLAKLEQDTQACWQEIKKNQVEQELIQQRQDHLQQEKEAIDLALKVLKIKKETVELLLTQQQKELEDSKKNLVVARRQRQEEEIIKRKKMEKAHQLQIQQARWETEHQNLLQRLDNEHHLTNLAEVNIEPVANVAQCQERVATLRNLIETMGTVNPGAKEEYQQVEERYTYLTQQKLDLDESKVSLQKLITEMDKLMSEKFLTAFYQIEKAFGEVFKELFGGGGAAIRMTGDNPLTAGIEIEAHPPGKKTQNINLLSGGERSLTAVALLFAILKVSPSPFCVLDEIDASLDEANVDRFAKFIQQFNESVQFVVITHRKGTMQMADTLYGVTMDNSSTSKVFSIELSKNQVAASEN